ncbi:polysaccharide biosynthesis tyrosine autokinase [Pseudonocardia sp. ICBG162]|uniref:polysaccharide biosynthesis tyrosine autokinase n=1 Tax=Pseudonocardia sp. ICBG162 TaxID=2846761 RepID=UPI001CF6FDBD|nr:polysaccharide biosynthesis tyrosine autokinase [Pseudonocardia sp. ICBG162]
MTLMSLLRSLRRRWTFVVAGLVLGLVAAGAVTLLTPRTYASTASLYVSAYDSSQSAQSAYQGTLLSQQRVASYAELLVSHRVLQPVADRLQVADGATGLADEVAIGTTTESTILTVTVDDRDPARATALVNGIAEQFTQVVTTLERPSPTLPPAVNVNVVDPGTVPVDPVSPKVWVNLTVGAVVGLLAGVGAALVVGSLDTTVRSRSDLGPLVPGSALGALPEQEELRSRTLVPVLDGTPYAEAVRRIRTNLLFAGVDDPPKVLAVASSVPGEGKTTLACSLAAAFCATGRVVVVEGDLRRPVMAGRLGLVPDVGLTDVLTRRTTLRDAVQPWQGSVDVLVCGAPPPNPNELLSSRAFAHLVDQLRADYDTVIIDGPPLVPVADGAIIASRSDGVVLLCRVGSTGAAQVRASTEALAAVGARVIGSVLTMTDPGPVGPQYGYGPQPQDRPRPGPATTASPRPGPPPQSHPGAPGGPRPGEATERLRLTPQGRGSGGVNGHARTDASRPEVRP